MGSVKMDKHLVLYLFIANDILIVACIAATLSYAKRHIYKTIMKQVTNDYNNIDNRVDSVYSNLNTISKIIHRLKENEGNNQSDSISDGSYTIDKDDYRYKSFIQDFPMFSSNKVLVPIDKIYKDSLLILTEEGSVLKYKWNGKVLSMVKPSVHFKTLHAATTFNDRHAQLFATFELLCDDKNLKGVYTTDTPNELDVVMRDFTQLKYEFNRGYIGKGMVIERIVECSDNIINSS
jgi:hypothetical protein